MNLWNHLLHTEPVLTLNVVMAIIVLGVGFGIPVTPMQVALIQSAVIAVLSWILRKTVVSPAGAVDIAKGGMPVRSVINAK